MHGLQHLVEGDELFHPAEGQLGGDESVGHPGGVAVLAGVLHQTAHRVAHQTQQVHQHGGARIHALLRHPAHKFHGGGGGHGGSHPHLRLTAAHRPRNGGVAHSQIAHGPGVEQGVHKAVVGDLIAVLEGQQQAGHNPGGARGGGRHNKAHGGVHFSHPHGVGHGPLEDIPADGLAPGGVVVEFFGFSADEPAHGLGRLFQRLCGGGPHDLQHFGHAVVHLIPGGLPQLALPAAHDL